MSEITSLQPARVWHWFDRIARTPRPSGKEEKMTALLEEFAASNGLGFRKDTAGNVLITKSAAAGYETRPTVILQSHTDMVCEKNADVAFDFDNDPIQPYIDGGWVKARGTTLGADCGIGVAVQLAILEDRSLRHGPLEALFTVNEEVGLTGAFGLADDMLSGQLLINLDSEDEGEIFIGCAGGIDTTARFRYFEKPAGKEVVWHRLSIAGLTGGHSGDDIDKGLGNAVQLLARIVWQAQSRFGIFLSEISGGNLRNAIPREAFAVVGVGHKEAESFRRMVEELASQIRQEYKYTEKNLTITVEPADCSMFIDPAVAASLVGALYACPNGVQAMSRAMEGLVETSTNLASVKMSGGSITVAASQRSSVESAKHDIASRIGALFAMAGAEVAHGEGYPGWTPDPSSKLLAVVESRYRRLFGRDPKVKAIHAGLECGLFLKKYPRLDMVSIGPTIKGAHSPDERLEIQTVGEFWTLLTDVLEQLQ